MWLIPKIILYFIHTLPMYISEIRSSETMTYLPAGETLMSVVVMKMASLACKMQTSRELTRDPTSICQ